MWILFAPAVLSFLALGAHYLRHFHLLLVGLCLATPFLLLIKRRVILRTLQLLLLLGSVEWLFTAWDTVLGHTPAPHPLLAAAIELGVGGFAWLAALLLQTRPAKMLYPS